MNDFKIVQQDDFVLFDDIVNVVVVLCEKFVDVMMFGFQVEFDLEEVEKVGVFFEDVLSEQDVVESDIDLVDVIVFEDMMIVVVNDGR